MQGPETRPSLIAKLHDPAASEAWAEFVCLYQPAVYRVARRRGLQHADAEDLAQDVLTTVSRKVAGFDFKRGGSFRGWLFRITRDMVINRLTRGPRDVGIGGSDFCDMLSGQPARMETVSLFRTEHQRLMLARAAERVRSRVSASIWKAFWLTAVGSRSIADAASQLGKSEGAVRVARCRVLAQIRKEVQADDYPFSL